MCTSIGQRAVQVLAAAGLWAVLASAQTQQYTVVLDEPPVAARFASREALSQAQASQYRAQIQQSQRKVREGLEARSIRVIGGVDTLLNALFVSATPAQKAEIEALPGVKGVVPARTYRPALDKAVPQVNAPAAWTAVGGSANAGKGVKIAIIDTGIDQNHPAFRNSTLPIPAGFPKCDSPAYCAAFTNNKVIVARTFLAGGNADDLSPRDRWGHGTASASCAAGESATGLAPITGVAPGAWLGNYKVFGAAGVNEDASDPNLVAAVEQAVKDGMDVINLSLGGLPRTGPLDSGADCGNPAGVACDVLSTAVEAAVRQGVVVVISSGNNNNSGSSYPTYNTIASPGHAPSAITVGASTNAHMIAAAISVPGQPTLASIAASAGSGGLPLKPVTARLVDVASTGNDGQACAPLPPGSLYGAIALVKDGGCNGATQSANTATAGAIAAILYAPASDWNYYSPSFIEIPGVAISNADGLALKALVAATPSATATITLVATSNLPDRMLHFSSIGPAAGDSALKPDLVAPGGGRWSQGHYPGIYMATQSFDSTGSMYNPDGFVAASGTSFSSPIVAGAAAVVKQAHPGYTPAQIKSALVNTAAQTVATDDTVSGTPETADARWFGAGRMDTGAAVATPVTATVTDNASDQRARASLSFGVITANALSSSRQLALTNTGKSAVDLTLGVATSAGGLVPAVSPASVHLAAGQSQTVSATLSGIPPAAGVYSGAVTVSGAGSTLRVPYLYFVSDGSPASIFGLQTSSELSCPVGGSLTFVVKVLDRFGVPVSGSRVHWINDSAKGKLDSDYSTTDKYGIATMGVTIDSNPGDHPNWAAINGDKAYQYLNVRGLPVPSINANGVMNSASLDASQKIAPGSYVTILGQALADVTAIGDPVHPPVSMGGVSVSFNVPSAGISAAARITYASPTQLNIVVPWELQGQSLAQMTVRYNAAAGKATTVALSDVSPAFFEIGNGLVAALDMSYQLISGSHAIGRGQIVQLFANGLGPATNQPATGEPAIAAPLSELPSTSGLSVAIGGQTAQVIFAGLAPGFPGLYQIDAVVPASLSPGRQSITVTSGGATSKASAIMVE